MLIPGIVYLFPIFLLCLVPVFRIMGVRRTRYVFSGGWLTVYKGVIFQLEGRDSQLEMALQVLKAL